MTQSEPNSPSDVESRRNPKARRLTLARRLLYVFGTPILAGIVRLLWSTCRVQKILGETIAESAIADDRAYVPCYWHRDIFSCLMTIRGWIQRGFRAGVIISPSVDGDVPAKIARSWGAEVIRGSAARTGALAMRDMHKLMKRGVSIVTAADGPVGPAFYFKGGILLTARIGSAALLPMASAASRFWQFSTWDQFVLPKPFARIVVAIGEPMEVPRRASAEEQESLRQQMQQTLDKLVEEAKQELAK